MRAMAEAEQGWYPDFVWRDGKFDAGVAFFADASGAIRRFSSDTVDLARAARLKSCAVLPGFVNAHSHAFQRAIRGRVERRTGAGQDSFWTWREGMYRAANRLTPDDVFDVARMAFVEMLAAGITTVGEFHYLHHAPGGTRYDDPNLLALQVIRAAQDAGLRIALLRSAYARAGWQKEPDARQRRFITEDYDEFLRHTEALVNAAAKLSAREFAWAGLAPHSIRAVPLAYLRECIAYARQHDFIIHMHLAEQPAELEACRAEYGCTPVELLDRNGLLDRRFTAVHATHTSNAEIAAIARASANVCACPTTERNLGDGIAPADCWAKAGIDVCFGSDSNVQIDMLEDARELEYHLRLEYGKRSMLEASCLLEHATRGGARSLGAPGSELLIGRPADFSVLDLNDLSLAGADIDSLPEQIVFAARRAAIRDVYVAGRPVIKDRRHARQEEITARFIEVQKRLWDSL
ncbi:MAG TPA: formimidoylglutamate deiminase [Bryobacteraceae bacterium]